MEADGLVVSSVRSAEIKLEIAMPVMGAYVVLLLLGSREDWHAHPEMLPSRIEAKTILREWVSKGYRHGDYFNAEVVKARIRYVELGEQYDDYDQGQ